MTFDIFQRTASFSRSTLTTRSTLAGSAQVESITSHFSRLTKSVAASNRSKGEVHLPCMLGPCVTGSVCIEVLACCQGAYFGNKQVERTIIASSLMIQQSRPLDSHQTRTSIHFSRKHTLTTNHLIAYSPQTLDTHFRHIPSNANENVTYNYQTFTDRARCPHESRGRSWILRT